MTEKPKPKHGPPLNFREHTNFDGITPKSTHGRDVAAFDAMCKRRPMKPPAKRSKP